jgi:hypothetical protein
VINLAGHTASATIADILRGQKCPIEAEAAYDQALAVYRTHPDTVPLDHANALRGVALIKDHAGDAEHAILLWRAAKALYETSEVEAGVAECESHIAFLLHS